MIDNQSNLVCPSCFGEIEPHDNDMECLKCHKKYDVINGIPIMVKEESCDENKDMNPSEEDIHIKNNVRGNLEYLTPRARRFNSSAKIFS